MILTSNLNYIYIIAQNSEKIKSLDFVVWLDDWNAEIGAEAEARTNFCTHNGEAFAFFKLNHYRGIFDCYVVFYW